MGLLLIFLAISIIITILTYVDTYGYKDALTAFIICILIFGGVSSITWMYSYSTKIGLYEKYSIIEQYKESISIYSNKGIVEFSYNKSQEVTDLKYQNYQTQIGKMITDLRDLIADYNRILIGKEQMKKSWVFNWYIFVPNDLRPLKMSDYIE